MTSRSEGLRRLIVRTAASTLVAGFALFIWPTRYRYDRLQMLGETAPGPVYPVRIDRFTGTAEILLPQMLLDSRHNMRLDWVGTTGDQLPEDAVATLRSSVLIDTTPLPFAQILNTTEWRITRIRWELTPSAESGANATTSPRAFDQTVFIEPHSVASLYLDLGRFGRDVGISLHSAWGERRPAP